MITFTNELDINVLANALSAVLSAQRDLEVTVTFEKKETNQTKKYIAKEKKL